MAGVRTPNHAIVRIMHSDAIVTTRYGEILAIKGLEKGSDMVNNVCRKNVEKI